MKGQGRLPRASGVDRSTVPKLLEDWELWACAHHTIKIHALDAPIHAAMRSDELLALGDLDGARAWRMIVERVHRLLEPLSVEPN